MFHIFFVQSDMILGIVNPFSWILNDISSLTGFPANFHWSQEQ